VVAYNEIPDNISHYSLILLSSSSRFRIYGNEEKFTKEIDLIRVTEIPVIGICLGHELIAHTFNSLLTHFDEQYVGMTEVEIVNHQKCSVATKHLRCTKIIGMELLK
jgi:GMP synthase-like glutamine amidotransferase